MSHETDSPTREESPPDLVLTNTEELIRDVKIGGSLVYSDRALVELRVLRDVVQVKSIIRMMNFRRVNFQLLMESVYGTSWETALRGKGGEQSLQFFKNTFFSEFRNTQLPCVKNNQVGKAGEQQRSTRTFWSS